MANIKHTKNEMKAQREALSRFERFLPMLQLKKQQLQAEIQAITARVTEKQAEEKGIRAGLSEWIVLFSESSGIEHVVSLEKVEIEEDNIAGVAIPVLKDVVIDRQEYDLFDSPLWFDDATDVLQDLIRLRVERETLEEQRRLIAEELRVTSQRVNLFEKVKIPECKEHIRIIKIFLGDEQTAAVVRGKFAKKRTQAFEYEDEAA